jgi:hypothetical protein
MRPMMPCLTEGPSICGPILRARLQIASEQVSLIGHTVQNMCSQAAGPSNSPQAEATHEARRPERRREVYMAAGAAQTDNTSTTHFHLKEKKSAATVVAVVVLYAV